MSNRNDQGHDRPRTQHDRARAWQGVVAARARGDQWRDIADRAQLSERQCRRIYRAHMRSEPTTDRESIVNEIEDAVMFYDAAIEDLAMLAETTSSDYVRIAAIRARVNARTRKMELMSVAGVFDAARVAVDVRTITAAIMTAFDAHDVPDEARSAVLAALRA